MNSFDSDASCHFSPTRAAGGKSGSESDGASEGKEAKFHQKGPRVPFSEGFQSERRSPLTSEDESSGGRSHPLPSKRVEGAGKRKMARRDEVESRDGKTVKRSKNSFDVKSTSSSDGKRFQNKRGRQNKSRSGKQKGAEDMLIDEVVRLTTGSVSSPHGAKPAPAPKFLRGPPGLNQILRKLFSLSDEEKFSEVIGHGPWFDMWAESDIFKQICSPKADPEKVLLVASTPMDVYKRYFSHFLGPSLNTERENSRVLLKSFITENIDDEQEKEEMHLRILWDQRTARLDPSLYDGWFPSIYSTDVWFYEHKADQIWTCMDMVERWQVGIIEVSEEDIAGLLVSTLTTADARYEYVIDSWALLSTQARVSAWTTQSLRDAIFRINREKIWAGIEYCPSELMIGMVCVGHEQSRTAHASSFHSGQFWRNSGLQFFSSLPGRLGHLTAWSFAWGMRGAHKIQEIYNEVQPQLARIAAGETSFSPASFLSDDDPGFSPKEEDDDDDNSSPPPSVINYSALFANDPPCTNLDEMTEGEVRGSSFALDSLMREGSPAAGQSSVGLFIYQTLASVAETFGQWSGADEEETWKELTEMSLNAKKDPDLDGDAFPSEQHLQSADDHNYSKDEKLSFFGGCAMGLPTIDLPFPKALDMIAGAMVQELRWDDPDWFDSCLVLAKTTDVGAEGVCREGRPFVFFRQRFARCQRNFKSELVLNEEFQTLDYWKQPRTSIEWRQPQGIHSDHSRQPGFIGYYDFGWPLYSPYSDDSMHWMVAVNRLGPEPPFTPESNLWSTLKHHRKTHGLKYTQLNKLPDIVKAIESVLLGNRKWFLDYNNFRQTTDGLSRASLCKNFVQKIETTHRKAPDGYISQTRAFLRATFPEITTKLAWEMTKDMANQAKRMGDLSQMQQLWPADVENTTCFTKSDEILTDAKPRLIHNAGSLIFWSNRHALQNFAHVMHARQFLTWSVPGKVVTLTYGGSMDPLEKGSWRNVVESFEVPKKKGKIKEVHILVGGDDIVIIVREWENNIMISQYEIELDISKCDQSQNDVTYSIFCVFVLCVYGFQDEWLVRSVGANMETSTPFYKQKGRWLQTGQGETTTFNSGAVGGTCVAAVLILDEYTEDSITIFFNTVGYDVKVSRVRNGCGTFHKGYWAKDETGHYYHWLPLPSRFVKFGWKSFAEMTAEVNLLALEDHLAAVSRGWASMALDPVFNAFVRKFYDDETKAIRPNEFGAARAWKKWDWSKLARQENFRVRKFYKERYHLDFESVVELIEEIEEWPKTPLLIRNSILHRIYVRDYVCDTQADFDRYLHIWDGEDVRKVD